MLLAVAIVGAVGYLVYTQTLGRPLTVKTIMVQGSHGAEPAVLLTGSGYIVTRHKYITIGTKILGQIVEEPIEEGQHVKKGQVLARIDDRDYQAQLKQAVAIREMAQANARLTAVKADRARRLARAAISTEELESAINAADVGQAQLKRDMAAVEFAEFQVSQCVITSPINGIVLRKYRELGDTINFGGQIQAGGGATDIVQLADTEDMRAEVDINEAEIAKVAMGSPATVVPDAYPDRRFNASLVKIYPAADRQKGTVKIEVQIDKPDLQVTKPEMSVKVSFLDSQPAGGNEPLLIIPKDTVTADGGETYVWAVRGGLARRVPIVRGRDVESGVEVKQGLKDGDILVLAPPANLSDGLRVFVAH
jgi:RND family efflux transporter MFP subunit